MKSVLFFTVLLFFVSCGKNNESGKPNTTFEQNSSPYTGPQLELIRQDFIREGRSILKRYEFQLKRMFGPRTVSLIQSRLRQENIELSEAPLYGERNLRTRSTNRNELITLYIGQEYQNLSWANYHHQRDVRYTRLVMHELLLLGGINDRNFVYTKQILGRF